MCVEVGVHVCADIHTSECIFEQIGRRFKTLSTMTSISTIIVDIINEYFKT